MTSVTGEKFNLSNVLVTPQISSRFPGQHIDVQAYPHLADIPLPLTGEDVQADMIIGLDNSHLMTPIAIRRDMNNLKSPYATLTPLGWNLQGPVEGLGLKKQVITNFVNTLAPCEGEVFKFDSGELEEFDDGPSQMDKKIIEYWDSTCVYQDGHYTLPIPWIDFKKPHFPNNYNVALRRLNSLKGKLDRDGKYEEYDRA